MRLFIAFMTGALFISCSAWAQQDKIAAAVSNLETVLATFKQSAEKLSADNAQWNSRNKDLQKQVLNLQQQLQQLQAQGDDLHKAAGRLQENNPARARYIARVEKEKSVLDDRIQKNASDIKSIQKSLEAESKDYQAAVHRQKEKLALLKMINDSQQRQELLKNAILEFQKTTAPLKNAPQGDDARMRQMEEDINILEQNYLQLKGLMEQMVHKVQSPRMAQAQRIEEKELEGRLEDLNSRNKGLRAQLEALRSQMIELDKRKSRLEQMASKPNRD
ncbi:MAG: hypothetical protein KGJ09_00730 [Candidatus Omnitrophica bacterium]|nr:hypothetical protein [Candidatus Omnitrophota bacterium]MDE2008585.1 hypothetical protein [Candidatus Omnitrophota bacterium]MDE2214051.1 hypothetical protein [Candidatus Omnitrophota bacterium]